MSDQYTPTGGQTIFPRINFLKTFSSRFDQRSTNGRIFLSGGGGAVGDVVYGITNAGGVFNLRSTGTVDYEVDWGDGNVETSTLNTLPHTYAAAGNYDLVVNSDGVYRPFLDNVAADATQITSVAIGSGADLGTDLIGAWTGAANMTSFVCPFDVTSSVTDFKFAWYKTALTSFPSLDFSSATSFYQCWTSMANLATFPPNMFDTTGGLNSIAFDFAWTGCALTAQSIENILVSLDTNGASNVTLGIDGGTNAAKTTWSAAAVTAYDNLIVKGWTISFNA